MEDMILAEWQWLKPPFMNVVPRMLNMKRKRTEISCRFINYGTAYIMLSTAIRIPGYRFTILNGFSTLTSLIIFTKSYD